MLANILIQHRFSSVLTHNLPKSILTIKLTQIVKNFQGLVFVDVYADYCPTCMQMLPVVDRAAQEYAGRVQFIKVDMDDEGAQSLLEKYNVRKVPHILIFKNGQLTNEMKTTLTYKELTELIDGLL